ncbi:hypothetical protein AX16_007000 [Volvariella volvacea WC 439]|nr:hypothetical protein AX16_007000 [Volvariella volvacea WC 439]
MSQDKVVLVTGASGFVGSHIIYALLNAGYSVRGAVRSPKLSKIKKDYANVKAFEAVEISDIVHGQFSNALQGVYAVIHIATPLPGRTSAEELFQVALEGSLNVLQQAEKAGVKKIVFTSSLAAVTNPDLSFTDQDWCPVTKEDALVSTDTFTVYSAAKAHAEKAVWAWAEEHPHVEVATVVPPYLYGPLTPYFPIPTPDCHALSSNIGPYNLLATNGTYLQSPAYADIRDAAKAHVALLEAPPTSEVGRKRILFCSPHGFSYDTVLDLIREKRTGLKNRLITKPVATFPHDRVPISFSRIEQVIGMRIEDFHTLEETILDTVDSLIALEAKWMAKGCSVDILPPSID